MTNDSIPFLPYGRQSVDEADIAAVVEVLRSDYLTTGPAVAAFEAKLARAVGAEHAVVVSSGTMALHAAYAAAGIGPGDEVVVPATTFLATANAARYVGADPVFTDVDPDTGLMSAAHLEARVGKKTRAIVPVHLNGMPCDLQAFAACAERVGAIVIEDAAHALGASYRDRPVGCGAHSRMTVLSFHPVKHITTGEGGAVVTNDEALAKKLRQFRNHGMTHEAAAFEEPSPGPWYYEQQSLGHNGRITDIQCALGCSQLDKLDGFIERRRQIAERYDRQLAGLAGVQPVSGRSSDAVSAYHLYAVLIDFERLGVTRAQVMQRLRERGIGTQVHYIPVPSQPYYRRITPYDAGDYPGAVRYYQRELSLPMYPALLDSDVDRVVRELRVSLGI